MVETLEYIYSRYLSKHWSGLKGAGVRRRGFFSAEILTHFVHEISTYAIEFKFLTPSALTPDLSRCTANYPRIPRGTEIRAQADTAS